MGAWGNGLFENDDAADFADELSETTDSNQIAGQLRDALSAVTSAEGYVEAPEMSCALAAAALVALSADSTLPAPSSLDEEWLESLRAAALDHLKAPAAHVLVRALEPEDNEWFELWAEAEALDEVRRQLAIYGPALN